MGFLNVLTDFLVKWRTNLNIPIQQLLHVLTCDLQWTSMVHGYSIKCYIHCHFLKLGLFLQESVDSSANIRGGGCQYYSSWL
jgi:hypothetical protein